MSKANMVVMTLCLACDQYIENKRPFFTLRNKYKTSLILKRINYKNENIYFIWSYGFFIFFEYKVY